VRVFNRHIKAVVTMCRCVLIISIIQFCLLITVDRVFFHFFSVMVA